MFFRSQDRGTLRDLWFTVLRNHNVTTLNLARMEKLFMTMMDDVNAKLAMLSDGVKALVAAADNMKAAYDDLKAHPKVVEVIKEDPALADVAAKVDAATKAMTDEAGKLNVSGAPA